MGGDVGSILFLSGASQTGLNLRARRARRVHQENRSLVEDVVVVLVMVVVSSFALYSVPSFPLSMYINTDDVCYRRKQKTGESGPRLPAVTLVFWRWKLIIK